MGIGDHISLHDSYINIVFKDKNDKTKISFFRHMGGHIVTPWDLNVNLMDFCGARKPQKFYGNQFS